MVKHKKKLWGTFLLLFLVISTANAQGKQNHLHKSGYGDVPRFGGPSSVGGTLEEDDRAEGYRFDGLQRGLKPYFDWKARINEKHGLAFSFDYTGLYQGADDLHRTAGAQGIDVAGVICQGFVGNGLNVIEAGAVVEVNEGKAAFGGAFGAHPAGDSHG